MRFLLPLLLGSVATAALAEPVDPGTRAARFEQRQQQRQERGERPQPRFERPAPVAAPQVQVQRAPPPQVQVNGGQRRFDGARSADGGQGWRDRRFGQPSAPPAGMAGVADGASRPARDSVADWRWRERRGGERPTGQPNPTVRTDGATYGTRDGRDFNRDRGGWQGRDGRRDVGGTWTGRDGRTAGGNWTGRRADTGAWRPDWRRDPRYDWQRYRDRNRAIFSIGAYIDPFGWGYRPVGIGYQLYPDYYADQYWLSDPSYYDLPPVGWPYRWVRYYNDALLIDVRDGQVVDAIPSFFW